MKGGRYASAFRPPADVSGRSPTDSPAWIFSVQLVLDVPEGSANALAGAYGRTFRESKQRPVHRWFSYVEGFSADYLVAALDHVGTSAASCYDPFGGTGTTLVEASQRGVDGFFAEANPVMAFVTDTKVNAAAWAARNIDAALDGLRTYRAKVGSPALQACARDMSIDAYEAAFPGRDFFDELHLRELLVAVAFARELGVELPAVGQLALLACTANVVACSHMTRRADLRRRRPDEYKTRRVDVASMVCRSVELMEEDLRTLPPDTASAAQVALDCRHLPPEWTERFDCAVTSPPYLNGTNYVRNTKLELFILGFITTEADLGPLRHAAVRGGITQAATSVPVANEFPEVEEVATQLDEVAADRRIPHLVRAYFSDMFEVLTAVHRGLRGGAPFLLDIGDSRFYGVHVPTDQLMLDIAKRAGFTVEHARVLARRYSRDKSPLVQADLMLRKPT